MSALAAATTICGSPPSWLGPDGADHRIVASDRARNARRIEHVSRGRGEPFVPQIELGRVARYCCDPVPARKSFFSDTAADHAARPEQCDIFFM